MKKQIILLFLLFPFTGITQTSYDTTLVILKPTKTIKLFEGKGEWDYDYCCSDRPLFIYGYGKDQKFGTSYTVKVFFNGKYYICKLTDLELKEKDLNTISNWSDEWEESRSKKAEKTNQLLEEYKKNNERIEYLKSVLEVENAIKQGLVFIWSWSENGSSFITQDFKFSILNASKKKIKYIYTTVNIKNPVGDLINKKTLTSIGPIEPNETGSYSFESVFFSNVVKTASVTSVKILYFDGTSKLFTSTLLSKIIVSEESLGNWIKYIEEKSSKTESN